MSFGFVPGIASLGWAWRWWRWWTASRRSTQGPCRKRKAPCPLPLVELKLRCWRGGSAFLLSMNLIPWTYSPEHINVAVTIRQYDVVIDFGQQIDRCWLKLKIQG